MHVTHRKNTQAAVLVGMRFRRRFTCGWLATPEAALILEQV